MAVVKWTNPALNQNSSQSSQWPGEAHGPGLAVDGLLLDFARTKHEAFPWWSVFLGIKYLIVDIVVNFRGKGIIQIQNGDSIRLFTECKNTERESNRHTSFDC